MKILYIDILKEQNAEQYQFWPPYKISPTVEDCTFLTSQADSLWCRKLKKVHNEMIFLKVFVYFNSKKFSLTKYKEK